MKYNGGEGRDLVEERHGALGAEQRLAGASEGRADVRTFSMLQQNDANQKKADNGMNYNN